MSERDSVVGRKKGNRSSEYSLFTAIFHWLEGSFLVGAADGQPWSSLEFIRDDACVSKRETRNNIILCIRSSVKWSHIPDRKSFHQPPPHKSAKPLSKESQPKTISTLLIPTSHQKELGIQIQTPQSPLMNLNRMKLKSQTLDPNPRIQKLKLNINTKRLYYK